MFFPQISEYAVRENILCITKEAEKEGITKFICLMNLPLHNTQSHYKNFKFHSGK